MSKPITQPATAPFLGMLLLRRGKKGSPAGLAVRPHFPSVFRPSPGTIHPSNPAMCPLFITFLPVSVKYHYNKLVGRLPDAKFENEEKKL
jgi:hypothetical protein